MRYFSKSEVWQMRFMNRNMSLGVSILQEVQELDQTYPYYPECRHLATKSRMYRNIILDSHLIIYRITEERIEVLDIVDSASSMRKIKKTKNIHIE